MVSEKDNQNNFFGTKYLDCSVMTRLGERAEQQDCYGYAEYDNQTLLVLCDGMGGHEAGRRASRTGVETIIQEFEKDANSSNPAEVMRNALIKADSIISAFTDESGNPIHSGSTAVCVLIREKSLYWATAGDSRAYLIRGGEKVQLALDHNYKTVLDEKLASGVISEEEYNSEIERGEALISFLGIGDLSLIDYSDNPIALAANDRILIMSDGVYRTVSDTDLVQIADNFFSTEDVVQVFDTKLKRAVRPNNIEKDNATVFVVKIL